MKREIHLLAGITATGKSAAAAILARETGAAILSADSMLVYRGMDIGTAKPSKAEREEFTMGGVDLVTPDMEFSAGEWMRRAAEWEKSLEPGRPIIVTGGTGLYFTALLRGIDGKWTNPPPSYPVLRMDRVKLRERIARRIDAMFAEGLEEEVNRLKREYPTWSRTAAAAIGYKEFFEPPKLEGRTVKEEIYFRTSKFAKRQETWFRHQASPIWIEAADTPEETAARIRKTWKEMPDGKIADGILSS